MTHKYREGDTFEDVGSLATWTHDGGWVYWRGVPKHPDIIRHMTFDTVEKALPYMRRAVEIQKENHD